MGDLVRFPDNITAEQAIDMICRGVVRPPGVTQSDVRLVAELLLKHLTPERIETAGAEAANIAMRALARQRQELTRV